MPSSHCSMTQIYKIPAPVKFTPFQFLCDHQKQYFEVYIRYLYSERLSASQSKVYQPRVMCKILWHSKLKAQGKS